MRTWGCRKCKVLEWYPQWLEQIFPNLGMMVKERVSNFL
ncbi:hypothetical protein ATORI0001_1116 [Lancefieldella rimae ATCC 49626]|uniref:Uncharacterized protein n=1 Tax=Lancefieldella rimae (strain ATCC 49626 / DSM 7090 / CCUG 31168 / NBRC 15546 / VPI D140H-11A) TaxID=553184 RepID=B9CLE2_LANR4|nr:hypothetical protein ATORI0001_1116 [Lancefieldella rimae ATCC 49626]